jgi:hypothetical protein
VAKVDFYHWALAELRDVWTFTLRLRDDVEAEARSRDDGCDWLRRRVARNLRAGLSRNVHLFGVFEEDDNRRLHLHGEFNVNDNEIERAKKCLREAGGVWTKARQHQAKTHPYRPDEGWASYVGKNLYKATPFLRSYFGRYGSPDLLVSYRGDPLFASREIGRRAKALFNRVRWKLIRARAASTV